MCIHKLTGNAMTQAKENHIGIIQVRAEAEVCLADEVAMYRSDRSAFRRSRRR